MKENNLKLKNLQDLLSGCSVLESLEKITGIYPGSTIFTTSFGLEDQVISHLIFTNDLPVKVATIDTGRLFRETYDVYSSTLIKYRKKIDVYFPDSRAVEELLTEKGPYSFYESVENRKECCSIRKISPLNRALAGIECWISGIRADQSENRQNMDHVEYDAERSIIKFYPLFNWSFDDVSKFARENNIPYNKLHDKGFVSIGCAPCTRAIKPGEDFRAGRWWWEQGKKECGLHDRHS
jgi:phosphoadenosine phosphosulfate reductase